MIKEKSYHLDADYLLDRESLDQAHSAEKDPVFELVNIADAERDFQGEGVDKPQLFRSSLSGTLPRFT
jgi:hypothetical protein